MKTKIEGKDKEKHKLQLITQAGQSAYFSEWVMASRTHDMLFLVALKAWKLQFIQHAPFAPHPITDKIEQRLKRLYRAQEHGLEAGGRRLLSLVLSRCAGLPSGICVCVCVCARDVNNHT
eukprot:1148733-Pelagomonas_calceolata.AAC.5